MNNVSYSVINGIYYASSNSVLGFVAYYLLSKGATNSTIGTLIAAVSIINAFLQPALGHAIDHSSKIKHSQVICILAAMCFISGLCLIVLPDRKWCLLLLFTFIMVVNQLNMPIINSLCVYWINHGYKIDFGIARGVGSACYAIASFVIGALSDEQHFGPQFIPVSICITSGLLFIVMIVTSIKISTISIDTVKNETSQLTGLSGMLIFFNKYKAYMLFIIGTILVFAGHNVITSFGINIVTPMGGGSKDIGIINGIAAACELPTMFLFSGINKRISNSILLKIAGIFFTIKISLCFLAFMIGSMNMMYFVQILQMFGYALFIPASVLFTNSVIENEDCTFGQTLNTTALIIGTVLGSYLGGTLLDSVGVQSALLYTVIISAIGSIVIIIAISMIQQHSKDI